jgi:predicted nucleic acid-binding protein
VRVVSNASPLINLAAVGQLALLRQLYRRVIVPPAVWNEVVRLGKGRLGSRAVRAASWVQVKAVRDRALVQMLLAELDPGEAESIVLAREIQADLLLLDESHARRAARRMGLPITGLVGVLIEAAGKGLISDLAATLRELRDRAGFWLTDEVVEEALRLHRAARHRTP